MIHDVVAGDDRDLEDLELDVLADAPEIDDCDVAFDLDDLPWNAETHGCTSVVFMMRGVQPATDDWGHMAV